MKGVSPKGGGGSFLSVLHNPEMKLFLNVQMVISAALRRCRCGGTSWNSTYCLCMKSFRMSEYSLSSRCIQGWRPEWTSRACTVFKASSMDSFFMFLMEMAWM